MVMKLSKLLVVLVGVVIGDVFHCGHDFTTLN